MKPELLHPLLLRQLHKLGLTRDVPPRAEDWVNFLTRVDAAYKDEDKSRALLEHSVSLSTEETRALNDELIKFTSDIAREQEKLEATNLELERLVNSDVLTGLPNRASFVRELDRTLELSLHADVLFIDLDGFKTVNDSFGHAAGDEILKQVAVRLTDLLRKNDLIARFAGDEFIVLLIETSPEHILFVCEKILQALARPYVVDGNECFLSASLGAAHAQPGQRDSDLVIKQADWAMYAAKAAGKNQLHLYTGEMDKRMAQRIQLSLSLRRAVERDELSLRFQPRVHLSTGVSQSVEALLRWESAEHGSVAPSIFIAIAEETGLIQHLGEFVFEQACLQARRWEQEHLSIRVAVNVSAKQLAADDFVERVVNVLNKTGLSPALLEIEITESTAMANVENTIIKLNRLRALGVQISIDDFGTAYSSLNYLKRLPVHCLKIDRSFVRDIADPTGKTAALVSAIVTLGKGMNLSIVAEGVETPVQLDALQRMGCDEAQGFFLCRPCRADEAAAFARSKLDESQTSRSWGTKYVSGLH